MKMFPKEVHVFAVETFLRDEYIIFGHKLSSLVIKEPSETGNERY